MEYTDDAEPAGPGPYWVRAGRIVEELREVADTIEANPELARLPDPYDAAQQLVNDLDMLGSIDPSAL